MPIHRLTAVSVLAAALLVAIPAQATTGKTHAKPAHAQHKQTHSKPAHHKPAHGKLAKTTHHTAHAHSTASSNTVTDDDADTSAIADTAAADEVTSTSISPRPRALMMVGAPASANVMPAWLSHAPVFSPARMLVRSTEPGAGYFEALATTNKSLAASSRVAAGDQGGANEQAMGTAGAENVTDLRKSLITLAMKLRDIRYVRGGSNPSTGFDCSGFVRYVFAHATGIQLPANSASQFLSGLKVKRADMKPGDLVFFHTHGKRNISHVGIYISEGRFIHSPTTGKSVEISSLNDAYWAKRFAGAKRPEAIAQVARNG